MKRRLPWIGAGTGTLIAVSALVLTPIAGATHDDRPARLCVDNGSARHCTALISAPDVAGSSGRNVVVRASTGRGDAKDHPDFGPVTVEYVGRGDAKDHPNFGPVTPDDAPLIRTPLVR